MLLLVSSLPIAFLNQLYKIITVFDLVLSKHLAISFGLWPMATLREWPRYLRCYQLWVCGQRLTADC
ncbi:MAG: hypothetical protein F6K50_36965 [Moorea sp. SIO3I7]|uniref:hypothetical protein n=1 Tax=unclassified Moorena TaxID=2683338 RepID=UPI0013C17CD2|nr:MULTISPECIES: hypothetical protein [unclassified Moorena]NEO00822.1 hypothetical protein [Moorena sp. SIO3I7]NEO08216.1 hypothetical protein [Moorena sp. SIO3I8]NEO20165.1 hypothetical protein [Moorena sp. SIO4A5]NEP23783.1 hypothetical protein [Moorena sp. SIO3I6]NEQ59387.1 hypothetical protein [Moorena sp. SIO4A1]